MTASEPRLFEVVPVCQSQICDYRKPFAALHAGETRLRRDAENSKVHGAVNFLRGTRIYFRADAGFANPEVYEFLEAERIKYAIRLPANRILQERIGYLLTAPGRSAVE